MCGGRIYSYLEWRLDVWGYWEKIGCSRFIVGGGFFWDFCFTVLGVRIVRFFGSLYFWVGNSSFVGLVVVVTKLGLFCFFLIVSMF